MNEGRSARSLHVLFMMDHAGYLRYFDETLRLLRRRGHRVSLAFNHPHLRIDVLDELVHELSRRDLRVIDGAPARQDTFRTVARRIRATMDFVRYLDPRFARAEYYRNKRRITVFRTGALARRSGSLRTLRKPWVDAAIAVLGALEDAVPSDSGVERFLAEIAPDAVLVTPLVLDASPQTDYVKSARALGVPSGLCVASWDNLSNKGLMRVVPDAVMVWNDTQRAEAVDMHGAARDRVTVTGAQNFDRWFGRPPSTGAEEFRHRVGLPDRPFVLYVGSTSNIARAGVEEGFVRRWLEVLRRSGDPTLAGVPVLVRPHPERPGSWYEQEVGPGPVSLWPPEPPEDAMNVTEESRRDYYDSLYHATAVVGINTSAMLEAAILSNPVLTVRAPDLSQAHEGTLHFDYLLPENGGFLHVAEDLDEHVAQLAEALRAPEASRERNTAFVERFIRPGGLERPATPLLAEAVERLAESRPRPVSTPAALRYPLRALLWLYTHLERRRRERGGRRRGVAQRLAGRLRHLSKTARPHSKPLARALKRLADGLEGIDRRGRQKLRRRRVSRAHEFGRRLLDPADRAGR